MYNFLEYSDYDSMTGSLQNYYRDGINDDVNENNAANNNINNNKTIASKSIECKTKITERKPGDNNTLDTEVIVPLKSMRIFE